MTKIMLIAEKITDQIAFISMLRKMTTKTLSEIRESITQKKTFFEASLYGLDTDSIIQEILRFSKKQGNEIKILEQVGDTVFEISEEVYQNRVKRREETSKQFEEEDEEEAEQNEETE